MAAKKWSEIKKLGMNEERISRVQAEAVAELQALTLRQLREEAGKTQEELADLTEVTQSALSRIERRQDNPVQAIRTYVEALGGELEIVAVIGNKRIRLLGV